MKTNAVPKGMTSASNALPSWAIVPRDKPYPIDGGVALWPQMALSSYQVPHTYYIALFKY